jgi:hypothetical protein
MSYPEHLILFLILFTGFIIWGKYGSSTKNEVNYWMYSLLPILTYSVITGSRYGWGPDYLAYKIRLETALTYDEEQLGFKWINQTIKLLNIDYVGGFIIYSLIFMTSCFILIRSYRKASVYMYYFVIPATLLFVTNAIRQGLALSFVFLGLYFLNKKNWFGIVLSVFVGYSIHSSILVTVVIIGAVYLLIKKPIHWIISIPLYLFFTFLFDPARIGFISEYISKYVSFDNSFQSYIDQSDIWFGEEAATDIYEQNLFALLTSSLFYISIIYLGYVALKFRSHPHIVYIYNLVVIGIVMYRVVFTFEILRRIAEPLVMLYFIVLGYAFFIIYSKSGEMHRHFSKNIKNVKNQFFPYYKFFVACTVFYLVLFFGRFIFLNPTAIFYWNK